MTMNGFNKYKIFMSTVCDVLIKLLSDTGVRQIFGVPGDAINALTEAIRLQDKIKFVHVNHEENGAFAASAQAKLSGNLGVCCGTAGPGAIHLLNGLYDAKADFAPMLAITGQVETRFIGSNYHQEVDLHKLFSDVAIYNQVITNAEQFPYAALQAIKAALTHRGVAHLNIPVDIASQKVPNPDKWKFTPTPKIGTLANANSIKAATDLLNNHDKIVIVGGIGCYDAVDEVFELAKRLSAPIVHALKGKELFLENHPLSIGGIGALGVKPSAKALEDCDLIMLIGTDFPYFDFLPAQKKAIQIDINPHHLGRRIPLDVALAGDAKIILNQLLPLIKEKPNQDFLQLIKQHKSDWQNEVARDVNNKSNPIKPQRLAYLIGETADKNAIIISDTGLVTAWNARYLQMKKGQRYILSGSLATMAFSLGASIGAKLLYPDKQIICVTGDGGFSMLMTDFITAVKHNLKIVIIIFNNSKLGLITLEQEGKAGVPDYETDMRNCDFAEFAKICGGDGILVREEKYLQAALDEAFSSELPFIVNVMIDPDELFMPPKISATEVFNYAKAKIKENF